MPIEIPDGVGTIGDAHPNPYAPGINLCHNSFRVFVCSLDRTDNRTWRFITVHAGDGSEVHLYIRIGSLHLRDEIHPEFRSPQFGLFLSYKGDVILLPTGDHTGLTTRAPVQINHHSPTVHYSPHGTE